MKAAACLDVTAAGIYWRDAPPMVLRPTGGSRVHLLHAAGGPLGGDDLSLDVQVARDREVCVSATAATVVGPGRHGTPADYRVSIDAAAGAQVRWAPQATVVCAGATYRSRLRARVHPTASLVVRDLVVLGRAGEVGGRYQSEIDVTVGGEPLLRQDCLLDGADAELSGPGGSGGYRVLGTLLVVGAAARVPDEQGDRTADLVWAVLPLAGPGYLVVALGMTVTRVESLIDGWAGG